MDSAFWLDRWERGRTGFHMDDVNPRLRTFWEMLHAPQGATVFVPLCGKSLDMAWLAGRGHRVIGVELSATAARQFYAAQSWQPTVTWRGAFECFDAGGVRLLVGDYFELPREELANVGVVYDRAALIALPPAIRGRYVNRLADWLAPGTPLLLVTLEYPPAEMDGPPFAVGDDEVHRLYADWQEVELLLDRDILARDKVLGDKGLSALRERVYRIRR